MCEWLFMFSTNVVLGQYWWNRVMKLLNNWDNISQVGYFKMFCPKLDVNKKQCQYIGTWMKCYGIFILDEYCLAHYKMESCKPIREMWARQLQWRARILICCWSENNNNSQEEGQRAKAKKLALVGSFAQGERWTTGTWNCVQRTACQWCVAPSCGLETKQPRPADRRTAPPQPPNFDMQTRWMFVNKTANGREPNFT